MPAPAVPSCEGEHLLLEVDADAVTYKRVIGTLKKHRLRVIENHTPPTPVIIVDLRWAKFIVNRQFLNVPDSVKRRFDTPAAAILIPEGSTDVGVCPEQIKTEHDLHGQRNAIGTRCLE